MGRSLAFVIFKGIVEELTAELADSRSQIRNFQAIIKEQEQLILAINEENEK